MRNGKLLTQQECVLLNSKTAPFRICDGQLRLTAPGNLVTWQPDCKTQQA